MIKNYSLKTHKSVGNQSTQPIEENNRQQPPETKKVIEKSKSAQI